MTVQTLKGVIEAILFVSDRPLKVTEIAEVLGQDKKEISAALQELRTEYEDGRRGIAIREAGEGYKLFTNPCYTSAVEKFVASSMRGYLTQAALETLSIIAYKQPVTRAQISFIRG
ncbi:segregation and condensation protein B [Candidatus Hakubella thermalkaliphila]|nr:SMC-Scp complex subunit ScpB [Candidatus Hakubella thermalkaliphila]GFP27689.1 segregation and condensation protein B [Candidatus Hakubella thermalkaliphila]